MVPDGVFTVGGSGARAVGGSGERSGGRAVGRSCGRAVGRPGGQAVGRAATLAATEELITSAEGLTRLDCPSANARPPPPC